MVLQLSESGQEQVQACVPSPNDLREGTEPGVQTNLSIPPARSFTCTQQSKETTVLKILPGSGARYHRLFSLSLLKPWSFNVVQLFLLEGL